MYYNPDWTGRRYFFQDDRKAIIQPGKHQMNDLTPMMRQYLEIKSKYPESLLLYRMGDFYEMFMEDALTASKVLDIALTSRDRQARKSRPDVRSSLSRGGKLYSEAGFRRLQDCDLRPGRRPQKGQRPRAPRSYEGPHPGAHRRQSEPYVEPAQLPGRRLGSPAAENPSGLPFWTSRRPNSGSRNSIQRKACLKSCSESTPKRSCSRRSSAPSGQNRCKTGSMRPSRISRRSISTNAGRRNGLPPISGCTRSKVSESDGMDSAIQAAGAVLAYVHENLFGVLRAH